MAQKTIDEILFLIQARTNSTRVPNKMLRDFCGTNLFDISLKKILNSNIIPRDNFYASLYDNELKEIAEQNGVNIYHRSAASVSESKDTRIVSEWHSKLDFKYYVIVNPCCPLLRVETIDRFVKHYLETDSESLFGVHEVKNFYWNLDGNMQTKYPGSMDTKLVDSIYEAAHCLYAGNMSRIGKGIYLGNFTLNDPELFIVDEKETFDIDYEWQFRAAEALYDKREYILNG